MTDHFFLGPQSISTQFFWMAKSVTVSLRKIPSSRKRNQTRPWRWRRSSAPFRTASARLARLGIMPSRITSAISTASLGRKPNVRCFDGLEISAGNGFGDVRLGVRQTGGESFHGHRVPNPEGRDIKYDRSVHQGFRGLITHLGHELEERLQIAEGPSICFEDKVKLPEGKIGIRGFRRPFSFVDRKTHLPVFSTPLFPGPCAGPTEVDPAERSIREVPSAVWAFEWDEFHGSGRQRRVPAFPCSAPRWKVVLQGLCWKARQPRPPSRGALLPQSGSGKESRADCMFHRSAASL